jgi:SPP1 gp7 family putative phage head morphogenesis protein
VNTDVVKWVDGHDFDLSYVGIDVSPEQNELLRAEIVRFVSNQETVNQLGISLIPLFGDEQASIIAATEVTRAYAEGNLAAWRESGVTEGKEWITSVAELVCPQCGPLHGQVVPLDGQFEGGFDGPPAHPRCRCDIAPVVIGDDQRIEGGKVITVEEPSPTNRSFWDQLKRV